MATVKEIYDYIDSIAPFSSCEEWDNSGLLVGDEDEEVTKILFALDITDDIVEQAVKNKAELIITHHPVIFKPISDVLGNGIVFKMIKNGINIICAHTNYDKAVGGVNDILCNTIGLNSYYKLEGTCLNIGCYDGPTDSDSLVNRVKNALGGPVRYNSYKGKIENIAVCSGSGSDYLETVEELECDALITGDASHHSFLDADESDMLLIAAGHFETENIAIEPLMNKIKNQFDVVCLMAEQTSPINII